MLSDLPNVKFDVQEKVKISNEELSFKNLASLDLQPIVKVYDNNNEVEITGYLVLSGEFIVKNQYWEDQLDQFDALHYDTLLNNEYKVDSFQHQIPLSIQINNNRVEDISNVVVQVDEFDYEILSNQEIELIAQIKLIGVKPDSEEEQVQEKERNERAINEYEKYNILDNQHKNELMEKTDIPEVDAQTDTNIIDKNQDIKEVIENNITIKPKLGITAKPDKNDPNCLNPIYTLLKRGQKELKELVQSNPEENILNSEETTNTEDKTVFSDNNSAIVNNLDIDDDVAIVKSGTKANKDNILYGLLQGDEIQSYKLKLYIVQKDDTIEKIADKYGLNSEDIITKNNITNKDLLLGQLLYLPIKRQ